MPLCGDGAGRDDDALLAPTPLPLEMEPRERKSADAADAAAAELASPLLRVLGGELGPAILAAISVLRASAAGARLPCAAATAGEGACAEAGVVLARLEPEGTPSASPDADAGVRRGEVIAAAEREARE